MRRDNDLIDDVVRRLATVSDEQVASALDDKAKTAFAEEIVNMPTDIDTPTEQPATEPARAPRRARRPALAAAMFIMIAAVGGALLWAPGGPSSAIATPGLTVPVDADNEAARETLLTLAANAEDRNVTPTLPDEQRVVVSWHLSTQVRDGQGDSEVIARSQHLWHENGSTTECRSEPAALEVLAAQSQTVDDVAPCDHVERYDTGEWSRVAEPDVDGAEALVDMVATNEQVPDHHEVADAHLELVRQQPVSSRATAVTLRALAQFDEVRDYGLISDRADREVRAVGYTSDFGGLDTRYLLLIEPATVKCWGASRRWSATQGLSTSRSLP